MISEVLFQNPDVELKATIPLYHLFLHIHSVTRDRTMILSERATQTRELDVLPVTGGR